MQAEKQAGTLVHRSFTFPSYPTPVTAPQNALVNLNGSGIGLGHPVGSTGSRIMVTLLHAMKKRGKTLGLATLCGGGGVSMACALEML